MPPLLDANSDTSVTDENSDDLPPLLNDDDSDSSYDDSDEDMPSLLNATTNLRNMIPNLPTAASSAVYDKDKLNQMPIRRLKEIVVELGGSPHNAVEKSDLVRLILLLQDMSSKLHPGKQNTGAPSTNNNTAQPAKKSQILDAAQLKAQEEKKAREREKTKRKKERRKKAAAERNRKKPKRKNSERKSSWKRNAKRMKNESGRKPKRKRKPKKTRRKKRRLNPNQSSNLRPRKGDRRDKPIRDGCASYPRRL